MVIGSPSRIFRTAETVRHPSSSLASALGTKLCRHMSTSGAKKVPLNSKSMVLAEAVAVPQRSTSTGIFTLERVCSVGFSQCGCLMLSYVVVLCCCLMLLLLYFCCAIRRVWLMWATFFNKNQWKITIGSGIIVQNMEILLEFDRKN